MEQKTVFDIISEKRINSYLRALVILFLSGLEKKTMIENMLAN